MFHPPKIPQRQRNGNGTGLQWVSVANPLKADMAPVADSFFQQFLVIVSRYCSCNGFTSLLNLGLNLLNYNGFAMGDPLQTVGHSL